MLARRLKHIVHILFVILLTCFIFTFIRLPSDGNFNEKILKDTNVICEPITSLVFIKMIKCASSSLTNVFRKFGYTKNLSFVLPPPGRIYIGWPYPLHSSFYRPAKSSLFNLLCEHSIFDRHRMEEFMIGGHKTFFVTTIREPFSQFKSTVNYYNILNISRVPMLDEVSRLQEYINNIKKYDNIYKSHEACEKRFCIPDGLSLTKNLMSFNLGLQTGFGNSTDLSDDIKYIKKWLADLVISLDLVMIYEHLYESIVLLRRSTCWQLQDLILPMYNQRNYNYKNLSNSNLEEKYKKWSSVDYLLYDYFNATFWRKVNQQSKDFYLEVAQLKKMSKETNKFCSSILDAGNKTLVISESKWNEKFIVDFKFCQLLNMNILTLLQESYELTPPKNIDELKPIKDTC